MSSSAAIQVSRGALAGLSAGAGSLYMYSNGVVPSFISPELLRIFNYVPKSGQTVSRGGISAQELEYQKQLSDLTSEIARLRLQGQYAYNGSGGSGILGFSWTTIITVGGIASLVLYIKGYSFEHFMYVTKHALSTAVEALEVSIEHIGIALDTAKRELTYKLGIVEEKIDDTQKALENKISEEVGDVKRELENVGGDVKSISYKQEQVHGMVENIETQIDTIESRMETANSALATANRGIYLLCNVVAENMNISKTGGPNNRNRTTSLYNSLMEYTRSAMSSFSSGNDSNKNNSVDTPHALPSVDDGVSKLLELNSQSTVPEGSLVEHVLSNQK